jgi:hypothetical protein
MKKFNYAMGLILASGMLAAAPASAAVPSNLDQYGCRAEKAGEYKCYQGEQAGKTFKSQNDMLSKTSTRPMGSQVDPSSSSPTDTNTNAPAGAAPAAPPAGSSGSSTGGSSGSTGTTRY